jgi:hypothetical protein
MFPLGEKKELAIPSEGGRNLVLAPPTFFEQLAGQIAVTLAPSGWGEPEKTAQLSCDIAKALVTEARRRVNAGQEDYAQKLKDAFTPLLAAAQRDEAVAEAMVDKMLAERGL